MAVEEHVTLDGVELIKNTGKAVLVRIPDSDENIWIPRSHIIADESDDLDEGEIGTLTITAWIARQKGID